MTLICHLCRPCDSTPAASDWLFRSAQRLSLSLDLQPGEIPVEDLRHVRAALGCGQLEAFRLPAQRGYNSAVNLRRAITLSAIRDDDFEGAFKTIEALATKPPFGLAVRDVIIETVQRITTVDFGRGDIYRKERSNLMDVGQAPITGFTETLSDHTYTVYFRYGGYEDIVFDAHRRLKSIRFIE